MNNLYLSVGDSESVISWHLPYSIQKIYEDHQQCSALYFSLGGHLLNIQYFFHFIGLPTFIVARPHPNVKKCLIYDGTKCAGEFKFDKCSAVINLDVIKQIKNPCIEITLENLPIITSKAYELMTGGKYSNVVCLVDGKRYNCDRLTLASYSKYFEKVFDTGIGEFKGIVEIKSCSADIFDVVIKYMYTREIDYGTLKNEELDKFIIDLILAADFFYIEQLSDKLNVSWMRTMSIYNIHHRYKLALESKLALPIVQCEEYITEHMNLKDVSDSLLSYMFNLDDRKLELMKKLFERSIE